MRETWDHVYILPPYRNHTSRMSADNYHAIDDWYAEELTTVTNRILSRWRIDYCLANYVWFSKWLEQAPTHIPKYIDTHDVFANRHQRLIQDGLAPSWFSTTPTEESKGFNRADTIIAIQSEEAQEFAARTDANVATLGHFIESDFLKTRQPDNSSKIRVGYLASSNPINQQSLKLFDASLSRQPELLNQFDFILAGDICMSSAAENTAFTKAGFVEDVREFYQGLDLVINPNIGGTGLKIKSIEAMAYGKPLVATGDAMVGIASDHAAHALPTTDALCDYLSNHVSVEALSSLALSSQQVITSYIEDQKQALETLFPKLTAAKHSADLAS